MDKLNIYIDYVLQFKEIVIVILALSQSANEMLNPDLNIVRPKYKKLACQKA